MVPLDSLHINLTQETLTPLFEILSWPAAVYKVSVLAVTLHSLTTQF